MFLTLFFSLSAIEGKGMDFSKKLEFGNYTLRFGDKVLLDYYDEIVFPSFLEMNHIRKIGDKSEYFFIDTECVVLDERVVPPVLGIKGRIIKNTQLRRDQIFDGSDIVEDYDELETAPSSFFLLILNTHRLILCQEVSGAPTIQNFQSTSQYCLNKQYEEYIGELFENAKAEREIYPDLMRVTKKALRLEIPSPKLRITTLTDEKSLEDFVDSFEKINNIAIKLLPTNQEEIDNDCFWAAVDETGKEMESRNTSVRFSNTDGGLNQHSVLEQLTSATKLANSGINVRGYDEDGDYMKGDNENFSLSCEMDDLSKDTEEAAVESYQKFTELVNDGKITLPEAISRKTRNVINAIYERFGR